MKNLNNINLNLRKAVLEDIYQALAFGKFKHGYSEEDDNRWWWFSTENETLGFKLLLNAKTYTLLEAFTLFTTVCFALEI